ncbi:GyrI-like domain-containing protein [Flavobacterium turcicum]|uniref:GyrI-like domain-containing protein n=1 Tax=Flavobacterium turcicum TaxID=2764718 RepID=A0ABR7JJA4_9FLAO|nr:GyrI-like domain-containing protein [Flavobacterium turcicum]MBC5864560.1 GyrI-like domain-containing protein [Flavobacterium turcicum]NHL03303.1 GyrI-like domain-containing protein [Flavobacterium turcicum]
MTSIIITIPEKRCIGMRQDMSFAHYKAHEVWQRFMPRRNEIENRLGQHFLSVQMTDANFWSNFNPNTSFQKWAVAEVTDYSSLPEGMEIITIPSGLCAMFIYKGDGTDAPAFFESIFTDWLPNSDYQLAHRPHFELLGEMYQRGNPDSEEEVYIPIELK